MKRKCIIRTPLGDMMALAEGEGLCGLRFVGQKYDLADTAEWRAEPDHALFAALRAQLDAYFTGQLRDFDLPLALRGSAFQVMVWQLLRAIPAGTTTTYGKLAGVLAERRGGSIPSAQAVGGAVGHNPISIVIPCHRVIGANGSLTGYAGGLERKAALLALERGD